MSTNKNKRLYSCIILFAGAGAVLAYSLPGLLNLPGIIMAALGIWASYKGKEKLAAIAGTIPSAGSFVAQGIYGLCVTCTVAATLFAIAAAFAIYEDYRKGGVRTAGACLALIIAGSLFLLAHTTTSTNTQTNTHTLAHTHTAKYMVYINPECQACEDTLRYLIKGDPCGKKWQPVVVPRAELYGAERKLSRMGYMGEIMTADDNPGNVFPTMQIGERLYTGKKQIIKKLEEID